jgi:hypothetical protein
LTNLKPEYSQTHQDQLSINSNNGIYQIPKQHKSENKNIMEILEESRMMLELAISSLQRAGHDTEQFERTVSKIKALKQGKKLPIDSVVDTEGQLFAFSKFLLDRSYVRGKYYPETLVNLFKGK